jgi:hypothetical protein
MSSPGSERPGLVTVTVDTNAVDEETMRLLVAAARGLEIEFGAVTVTERELRGSDIALPQARVLETARWNESEWQQCTWARPIRELFVIGYSALDEAVLASDEDCALFEETLRVISNGAFPKPGARGQLSAGQRRQFRDAMIFEAHVRAGRHIFLTNDRRGFIDGDRQLRLERIGRTRIMDVSDFVAYCAGAS